MNSRFQLFFSHLHSYIFIFIFLSHFTIFRKFINLEYYIQKIRFEKIKIVYFNNKFDDIIKYTKHFKIERKIFVKRLNNIISKSIRRIINQHLIFF